MSDLAGALGRAVWDEAGLDDAAAPGLEGHLALVSASAEAASETERILQRSIASARAAGASWARIGDELGMSRQAAQQRFGTPTRDAADAERWLGPVTAFDELTELDAAGREGWHTVEAGMLSHRMVRTDSQWEHRRILWRASLASELSDGWGVGCRSFPWIYLVRDTGIPVSNPRDT